MNRLRFQIVSIYKSVLSEEESVVEIKRQGASRSIFTSIKNIRKMKNNIFKEDFEYIQEVAKISQSL